MMAADGILALAAPLLHALAFLVLSVAFPLRRLGRPAAYISILCAAGAFAAALLSARAHAGETISRLVWTWLPSDGGTLATVGVLADADSTMMLVLVALVALLVQVYSLGYLHDESAPALGRYYTYQSLFAFSMMALVLAPNFLQLFICWELVGLCSYLLIGFWYQRPAAARAALKAFWITKAGDVGFLIGIVLLWRHTGTFDLTEMRVLAENGAIPLAGLAVMTFCLYLGAVGKSAQFPLHIWLPDAMEGPTPVSALIHAATMVTAGVYMLHRTSWLFALTPEVLAIVAWVGAFTALLAAVLACVQNDIKRVLAYSTVSQLSYMMAAIGAGFSAAGFLHLLTHGVFKALLFLGAGAVIHAVGSNNLTDMGRLARRMPHTATVFTVGALSLAGLPLFAGFLSKEEILGAVLAGGFQVPFAMLILVAFLTAFYMFRVVFLAFFGAGAPAAAVARGAHAEAHVETVAEGAHAHEAPHAHEPPASMLLSLWLLALLSVAIGVYFTFVHPEAEFESPAWLMPLGVGSAVAGIALAWATYQRRAIDAATLAAAFGPIYRGALARFWIDDVFERAYLVVLLGFSRLIGWIDRYLVDGVLNVLSAWTVTAGDDLRTMQSGRAQDYVYGVAVGLLVLLLWVQFG
ncbi:MAG: NADH-quinone oxidoreductase subunit L [Acidobacteria bacterium]|nr:NADH-quinone oxidoreductase subunit L [Acidobacteriota bacterium]